MAEFGEKSILCKHHIHTMSHDEWRANSIRSEGILILEYSIRRFNLKIVDEFMYVF